MEFPQYMEQGSKGPAVNLVLVALAVYVAMSNDSGEFSGIEFDGVYGETGVRWMKDFQKINDLEVDVLVDDIAGLISFVNEIRQRFPGFIRDYRYLHIVETHKWNHNPDAQE